MATALSSPNRRRGRIGRTWSRARLISAGMVLFALYNLLLLVPLMGLRIIVEEQRALIASPTAANDPNPGDAANDGENRGGGEPLEPPRGAAPADPSGPDPAADPRIAELEAEADRLRLERDAARADADEARGALADALANAEALAVALETARREKAEADERHRQLQAKLRDGDAREINALIQSIRGTPRPGPGTPAGSAATPGAASGS